MAPEKRKIQTPSTNMPNLQRVVETNLPTLSGILIGFLGALFAAVAISDFSFLNEAVNISPLLFISDCGNFTLPFSRRDWIMLTCFIAGMLFYRCIYHCIWSQLSNYQEDQAFLQDQPSELDLKAWEKERMDHALKGLNRFNFGVAVMLYPFIFLLPSSLIAAGFYLVIIYWLRFIWEYDKKQWNIVGRVFRRRK